jgi:hypothetical protein
VLVSASASPPPDGSGVIWSLYLFKGRTFIRALSPTT